MGFEMTNEIINSIVTCKPWAVEQFLQLLRERLRSYQSRRRAEVRRTGNNCPLSAANVDHSSISSTGDSYALTCGQQSTAYEKGRWLLECWCTINGLSICLEAELFQTVTAWFIASKANKLPRIDFQGSGYHEMLHRYWMWSSWVTLVFASQRGGGGRRLNTVNLMLNVSRG
jgi:hypothetical protein